MRDVLEIRKQNARKLLGKVSKVSSERQIHIKWQFNKADTGGYSRKPQCKMEILKLVERGLNV
jgi:hypothetical protein